MANMYVSKGWSKCLLFRIVTRTKANLKNYSVFKKYIGQSAIKLKAPFCYENYNSSPLIK